MPDYSHHTTRHIGGVSWKTTLVLAFRLGLLQLMGTIFFLVGSVLGGVFLQLIDFNDLESAGDRRTTKARIVDIQDTGSRVNNQRVQKISYSFIVDNSEFSGGSYSEERSVRIGDMYDVEYVAANPEVSCLVGMRRNVMPVWALFVLAFPAAGLALLGISAIQGLRMVEVLKHGNVAKGKLIDTNRSNVRQNNVNLWRMTYQFQDETGRDRETAMIVRDAGEFEEIGDLQVAYLPENPRRSVILKGLPRAIAPLEGNILREPSTLRAIAFPLTIGLMLATLLGSLVVALG